MTTNDRERAARNHWARRRRLLRRTGRWVPVEHIDPTMARAHLGALRDSYGISLESLAILTGCPTTSVVRLLYPNHENYATWITPEVHERFMAAHWNLDALPDAAKISGIGSTRRLRALARMGWPLKALVERSGLDLHTFDRLRTGKRRGTNAATARAIRDLYDDLWDQQGPDNRTRTIAKARGWALPMAWDDDGPELADWHPPLVLPVSHYIEDANAEPHPEVQPKRRGSIELDVLLERIRQGVHEEEMADLFGVTPDALYVALRRKGHDDEADRLAVWSGRAPRPHLRKNAG